jgi:hypothetical protein
MAKSQVAKVLSMFLGSLILYSTIRFAVVSWGAIMSSGIFAFGVILFITFFTMVGLGLFLTGVILFKIDYAPEATIRKFKQKMKSLGLGDPYKVIVYGENNDNATSVHVNFHYRYYGKNYYHDSELKPTGILLTLAAKLPYFVRFSTVVDAVTGHIIVHDGYNGSWYLFEKSNNTDKN